MHRIIRRKKLQILIGLVLFSALTSFICWLSCVVSYAFSCAFLLFNALYIASLRTTPMKLLILTQFASMAAMNKLRRLKLS
jgi:hypothetical protein